MVNHTMIKNTKTRISWERNIAFLRSKKINLCLRWHILRSYCFAAEIIFKKALTVYLSSIVISKCKYIFWWVMFFKNGLCITYQFSLLNTPPPPPPFFPDQLGFLLKIKSTQILNLNPLFASLNQYISLQWCIYNLW